MRRYIKWVREFWKNFVWFQRKLWERFSFLKCIFLNIHFFLCAFTDGCSPEEYLWFEFYHTGRKERKTFLTYMKHAYMQKQYNSEKVREILDDKYKFNTFYKKEIGRNWIDVDRISKDKVETFIKRFKNVIVKPKMGQQGKGVFKYSYADGEKIDFSGCLLEECIIQHDSLQEFNPYSVNTLRVGTICVNGRAEIFAAGLRMGTSKVCVDNLHSGGLCANVDLVNGVVNTRGINGELERFDVNPYSGKKLIGFQIPYWEETKCMVKKATEKLDESSIIGWDVAITKKGPVLIEGNHDQGTDAIQACDVVGKYSVIQRIIYEVNNERA